MSKSTNKEHVAQLYRMANESWRGSPEFAALTAAIASLSAQQPAAVDVGQFRPAVATHQLACRKRVRDCREGLLPTDNLPIYLEELAEANRLLDVVDRAAPQPPAEAHCATCSCVPGMTPAVRFDATPAEKEGAVRDHLIRMGWTPPAESQPMGAAAGALKQAIEEMEGGDFGGGVSHACLQAMKAALTQQLAYDGGFTAADMMDARQEGRKEAQQLAAGAVDATIAESLRHAASRWKREAEYHASGLADEYSSGQRHAYQSCALEMLAILDQALAAQPGGSDNDR